MSLSEMSSDSRAAPLTVERGRCYVSYAFDVGQAIDLNAAIAVLGEARRSSRRGARRRSPPYFDYDPPPVLHLLDCDPVRVGDHSTGPVVEVTLYDFAAISLTYTIDLPRALEAAARLSVDLYENAPLEAHARHTVDQMRRLLEGAIVAPRLADDIEDYVVFHVERWTSDAGGVIPQGGELDGIIARLLRAEQSELDGEEVREAVNKRIRYGAADAVYVDWHATIVFDESAEDVRTVLEYANVELLELRYVDRELDRALEEAYAALQGLRWPLPLSSRRSAFRRVGRLQADNAMLFEGVNNAIKLIGDQYLARVYRLAADRFHLADWDASILRKLNTLESIYAKLSTLAAHHRAELLEWVIIILIALEIFVSWPH